MSRAHLSVTMPTPSPHQVPSGPSTPAPYEIAKSRVPRTLPVVEPSVDSSPCSTGSSQSSGSGGSATTSASSFPDDEQRTPNSALEGLVLDSPDEFAVGKGHSGADEYWAREDVTSLENILARPPPDLAFPPGSLPPPHVLDGLTSVVVGSYEGSSSCDGSAESSRSSSPSSNWPHSWTETRRKLVFLALADSRLGAELAERKMTRQERLARPGIKRVGSMDYLEEDDAAQVAGGKVSRVLSLAAQPTQPSSTQALATPLRQRKASLSVPGVAIGMGIPTSRPPPMRRCSSGRSDYSTSRRPSLLARGRSFTASDLEAEYAAAVEAGGAGNDQMGNSECRCEARGSDTETDQDPDDSPPVSFFTSKSTTPFFIPDSPTTLTHEILESPPATALAVPAAPKSPAVTVSAPALSPPSKRAAPTLDRMKLGRSKSYTTSSAGRPHAQRDSFLVGPAFNPIVGLTTMSSEPSHMPDSGQLGSAFKPESRKADTPGWESDSDRESVKPKKKRLGSLAMTAMKTAAISSGSASGSGSGSSESSRDVTPPLAKDETLRSPFEERPMLPDV